MKIALFISIILAVSIIVFISSGYSALGTRPSEADKKRFGNSPNFNPEKGVFDNRIPGLYAQLLKRFVWRDYLEIFKRGVHRTPEKKFPETKPDLARFLQNSDRIKIIWLGHSSLLINFHGKVLLIDPVLSESASPYSFLVKRFQAAPLKLEELPPIDAIVISHDHYDHLDMGVAKYFATEKRTAKFFVPLGVGGHLEGWGVDRDRITELDWHQSAKLDHVEFIASPAQHSSGRGPGAINSTLWASWVIRDKTANIYFSGDSGYDIHFEEIGKKYGPFDIAFVENGQYNLKWKEMHLLPEETLKAYKDLNAKALFPIHWGMFKLAWHPWYEPITRTRKAAKDQGIRLVSPQLGQLVEVDDGAAYASWWESLMEGPAVE